MGRPKKAAPHVEKAPNHLNGSFELLPEQHDSLEMVWDKLTGLAHTFGYFQVETPLVEEAKLFKFWEKGQGSLIAFTDAKQKNLALKPSNLFSLARIYLEYRYAERESISKWFAVSPVTYLDKEGEVVQQLEFVYQIFGQVNPIADAQIMNLGFKLLTQIGFTNLSLEVNNIGCMECQPKYEEVLRNYFKEKRYDLCESCLERLDSRPLEILACDNLSCSTASSEAPVLVDYLCEVCHKHFIGVLEGLDELGIVYNLNPKVVGSDWSRKTVFELRTRIGETDTKLVFGSHQDDMIQSLGGVPTVALGLHGFVEKIIKGLDDSNLKFVSKQKVDVFLVPLGDLAAKKSLRLFTELWGQNIAASEFIGPGSIKTQLKLAESNKVSIALIIGQKEARDGTVILRDVRSGMQELFTSDRIIEEVKKRLGR